MFPPTDFHSATLVGRHIYVIGNLGYMTERRPGVTPVYRLDVETLRIEGLETSGDNPGWIHKHKAACLDEGEIRISGGRRAVLKNERQVLLRNRDDYVLCLETLSWRRVG